MRSAPALLALLLLAPAAAAQLPLPSNPLAGQYLVHRNADVEATLKAWALEFPEFATVESLGRTTTGLDLWALTLAPPNATSPWRVYLDGGHHGNEYFGTEFVMAYLGGLVEGYRAQDPATMALLANTTVMALPIVNPEGNALDTRKNSRQVDLNRNYPFQWGGEGSGDAPTDGTYRGEGPASEPETQANIAAQETFRPDLLVTMHTGIAEMYWPWSYTSDPSPDDALWTRIEAPFEAASNGRLDAMQGAELYLTAGSSDDFAYAALGIPAFTIEVHEDQFVPVYPGGIGPEMADQLGGLHWLVENAPRLGANVQVAEFGVSAGRATVVLENTGWGPARNLTVTLFRGATPLQTYTLDVAPESTVTAAFDNVGGAEGLRVVARYPRLLLDTSAMREVAATPRGVADAGGVPLRTPAVEGAAVVLGLVAVALLRRGR